MPTRQFRTLRVRNKQIGHTFICYNYMHILNLVRYVYKRHIGKYVAITIIKNYYELLQYVLIKYYWLEKLLK